MGKRTQGRKVFFIFFILNIYYDFLFYFILNYRPSIKRALRKFVQKKFICAGFFKLGNDVFVFTGPLVLNGVINFLSSDEPMWVGVSFHFIIVYFILFLLLLKIKIICIISKVVWTCGLFVGSCLQSLCSNQYFFRGYRIGMHVCK